MNILFVVGSNSGTSFWRGYNFWEAAYRTRKCGFHCLGWEKEQNEMAPWQIDIADANHQPGLFGRMFAAGQQADVIVFQRIETRHALAAFYAMKDQFPDKPILSEIDDDIFDVAPYNPASWCLKPGSDLTSFAVDQFKNSDGMIVSTPYLKEVYSEFNDHIYVVPNSIDLKRWDAAPRKKKGGIRVGWIGSGSHSEDLKILETVIDPILQRNKDVKFVFASYFGQDKERVPEFLKNRRRVEIVSKWSPILKYPAYVASLGLDIGLTPLIDNKFNRGKSNLRWLEYSALGIPSVCSNVDHFTRTIRHGVDGYLANHPADFINCVDAMVKDQKLRKRIGKAAYARVCTDFNVDKTIDLYVNAANDCLSRQVVAAPSLMTGVDEIKALPMEVLAE